MDFIDRLYDKISGTPNLTLPVLIGYQNEKSGVFIYPITGSTILEATMDGEEFISLPFQIVIKDKDQALVQGTSNLISQSLGSLNAADLTSEDGSWWRGEQGLLVDPQSAIQGLDQHGYYGYMFQAKANIYTQGEI